MKELSLYIRIRGRIQGPLDLRTLRAYIRNGRLARFHDVSEDKSHWLKASDFPELFENEEIEDVRQKLNRQVRPDETTNAQKTPVDPGPTPERQWHYGKGAVSYGPVDTATITGLIQGGALAAEDQVWFDGMPNWQPLSEVPELAIHLGAPKKGKGADGESPFLRKRARAMAVAAIAGVVLLAVGYWAMFSLPSNDSPATNDIRSVEDLKEIEESIGMVVWGWEVLFASGQKKEIPCAIGSAFAISTDGHMLTNKHVVRDYHQYLNADSDHRKNYFAQMLIHSDDKKKEALERRKMANHIQSIQPKLFVFINRQKRAATVVFQHATVDCAIVKVEHQFPKQFRLRGMEPAGLLNEDVHAVGFPSLARTPFSEAEALMEKQFTDDLASRYRERDLQYSITKGGVSQVTRDPGTKLPWLQHTAFIAPGNSGGPLIDEEGIVLGVNTQKVTDSKTGAIFRSFCLGELFNDINRHVPGVHWVGRPPTED